MRRSALSPKAGSAPAGFTLLEVILAIAVLAIALAGLGEIIRLAYQSAERASQESHAQLLAESIMAELVSGVRPILAVDNALVETEMGTSTWQYSIAVEPTMMDGLVLVRVLVAQQRDARVTPIQSELVRWFPNPDYVPSGSVNAI